MTQVVSMFSPKNLVVTDLFDEKLALARKYGATHTYKMPDEHASTMDIVGADFPDGFDVVIPCLLEGDGMVDAINAAAQNGRIVMYGCIGTCHTPVDFFKVHKSVWTYFLQSLSGISTTDGILMKDYASYWTV